LSELVLDELMKIPREIIQSPFGVFMKTLFRDPASLFLGGLTPVLLYDAWKAGRSAAQAPMDPDEALDLLFGPSFFDQLGTAGAEAFERARRFAEGRITGSTGSTTTTMV
jgi:hypothetical protein